MNSVFPTANVPMLSQRNTDANPRRQHILSIAFCSQSVPTTDGIRCSCPCRNAARFLVRRMAGLGSARPSVRLRPGRSGPVGSRSRGSGSGSRCPPHAALRHSSATTTRKTEAGELAAEALEWSSSRGLRSSPDGPARSNTARLPQAPFPLSFSISLFPAPPRQT